MSCHCRAKGCNKVCDCGEWYCPDHLLVFEDEVIFGDDNIPPEDFEDGD